MNKEAIARAKEAVECMEKYLKTILHGKKIWEKTHVSKQIDNREQGATFTISDHIRGMVYAMLSSGISWKRVEKDIDENTGRIQSIDNIFHNYDVDILLSCSAESLKEEIKKQKLAGISTNKQLKGLIPENIKKLKLWEDTFGNIDNYYKSFIEKDSSYRTLIEALSKPNSENKMKQMSEALIAEYLRNVGYDIAKPDRHIRRILGCNILACSEQEIASVYEAMDIVREIAAILNKHIAEVDYILWSYCATGYGEICTSRRPLCCECVIRKYCRNGQEKPCEKMKTRP